MADATTTDPLNSLTNLGTTGVNTLLSSNALNQAQQQLAQGYGAAGQYIQAAQQQAAGYQQPYLTAGTNVLPQIAASAKNMASPYTMAQYQASPYWQVGQAAAKQAADATNASAAAGGMYGSGNMANALQQNYMNNMLQNYQNAQQADLTRQQAGVNALSQLGSWGYGAGQGMGNQALDSAKYMAGLAQTAGLAKSGGSLAQNALFQGLVSSLGQVGATLFNKYMSGEPLTTSEQSAWDNFVASEGGRNMFLGTYLDTNTGMLDTSLSGTGIDTGYLDVSLGDLSTPISWE